MAAIARLARRLSRERGAELIEMAIVTPILMMILAGIFDFGMMFRSWEVVTNAAREGARIGILGSYSSEDIRLRVLEYMRASGVANACNLEEVAPDEACTMDGTSCAVCIRDMGVAIEDGTIGTKSVTVISRQQLPSLSVIGTFFGGVGAFSDGVDVAGTSMMRTEVAATPSP
jgi:Flp pilus assembly protein TadG